MSTSNKQFALIGDSHSAGIGRVALARGISFLGGPLSAGRTLDAEFFHVNDDGAFVGHVGLQKARFTELFRARLPILSTVGFATHRIAGELANGFYRPRGLDYSELSDSVLRQVIADFKPGPLKFYRTALEHGREVYAAHSPQRFPDAWVGLALRLEGLFAGMLLEMGVSFVDVRNETTDESGRLRPEFFPELENDRIHANDAWAAIVLDKFLEVAGIRASDRTDALTRK